MKAQSSPVYQTDTRTGQTERIDNVTRVAASTEQLAARRVDAVSSGSAPAVMPSNELHYLRGWVGAISAAVSSGSMQTHLAASLLVGIGTHEEIVAHADSGDVDALRFKELLPNNPVRHEGAQPRSCL